MDSDDTSIRSAWPPPQGIDLSCAVTRSFWSWALSQTWFARLEGWERIVYEPVSVRCDLLAAAETYLEQLYPIWGLELHLDGFSAPPRLDKNDWRDWHRRFALWVAPWFRKQVWKKNDAVLISRPSDILWLMSLREISTPIAVCAHQEAAAAVKYLLPNVSAVIEAPKEAAEGDQAELRTLKKGGSDLEHQVRQTLAGTSVPYIKITPWGRNWINSPALPDRFVHEYFKHPKPWSSLSDSDREDLRALGHWINTASGRYLWSATAKSAVFESTSATVPRPTTDFTVPPLSEIILKNLARIKFSNVPLNPTIADWKELHARIFDTVIDDAGQFRRSDQTVVAGQMSTVQACFIEMEMNELSHQFAAAWAATSGDGERMAVVSWSQVRLQRLHPFPDGNGHMGRLWLARQACEFGHPFDPRRFESLRAPYREALVAATNGSQAALNGWLQEVLGREIQVCPAPFRLAPLMQMNKKV